MATEARNRKSRLTPSQARAARRARRQRRRRATRFAVFSGITIVAVVFIFSLFAGGLQNLGSRSAPDGPGQKIASQGRTHISPGDSHPPYSSVPATSGWHFAQPLAPVRWGIHDEALPDESLVHNLEHGGVGIHYNCPDGCDELVRQLRDIAGGAGKVIMSPYPGMDTTIALTAWTFLDTFDEFDKERVEAFVSAHVSSPNAPEPLAN